MSRARELRKFRSQFALATGSRAPHPGRRTRRCSVRGDTSACTVDRVACGTNSLLAVAAGATPDGLRNMPVTVRTPSPSVRAWTAVRTPGRSRTAGWRMVTFDGRIKLSRPSGTQGQSRGAMAEIAAGRTGKRMHIAAHGR